MTTKDHLPLGSDQQQRFPRVERLGGASPIYTAAPQEEQSLFTISSGFVWPHSGQIVLDDAEGLIFPKVETKAPGVYRLDVGGEIYVGETAEANGLSGRWKNYRRYRDDKPPSYTNNRINLLLLEATHHQRASVSWITADDFEIDIMGVTYDLNDKSQRKAIEGFFRVVEGARLNR